MKKTPFLVGILAGDSQAGKPFVGNVALFKQLQAKIRHQRGDAFVFTPSTIKNNRIDGFQYIQKKWIQKPFRFPDVVYNRFPFREDEVSMNWLYQLFDHHNIPFFNRHFFHKGEVYEVLREHEMLATHLPMTKTIDSIQDVVTFIRRYPFVYIKRALSSKGDGVFKITCTASHYFMETPNDTWTIPSIQEMVDHIQPSFQTTPYIIQEGIETDHFNGHKYDVRVYVHAFQNQFVVSGIGVRVSCAQSVTTHVPKGGKIIPFSVVSDRFNERNIKEICQHIGEALSNRYGLVGEFSVDIGRTPDGRLYIFEVNAKPMKFDEQIIYEQGLDNLVSYFYQLTTSKRDSAFQ
ncbi:YheC/YheD family protein [Bacillus kexueae]|uniref:YheC/YheD family endospore coat-associated protein n=1 Tax=Aeribacillus kexueae TaxID=2078952 RepID=UPI001FAE9BFA|nr:YheC/YheD family protein [Bacillus kexueae]